MTSESMEPVDAGADLAPGEPIDATVSAAKHDPYAAWRHRDFRLFFLSRVVGVLGEQMVGTAVGWQLYQLTGSELALGLVGLVQVLPIITLSLFAGTVVDRTYRRRIAIMAHSLLTVCSLALLLLTVTGMANTGALVLIYICLLGIGVARTFYTPAESSMLPLLVPSQDFTNAVMWSSNSWQLASVFGPAVSGIVIARFGGPQSVYLLDVLAGVIAVTLLLMIRAKQTNFSNEPFSLQSISAGAKFIFDTKVILAAVTLDMFAVLFGGAVALLPVYATDILKVGADGYGWLRAMPSIGALCMSLLLVQLPPFKRTGITLLGAVIGFGVCTIIFGLSTSFWLSLVTLFVLGALDNISVVIRHSLVILYTPDVMRGRISAVNNVFIGTSNELGAFESGVAAELLGPVGAVVFGGIGTILVVLGVGLRWPQLRNLRKLGGHT
ncbi:MAG: MFS transporter [Anaerolineae bacterium]